MQGVLGKLWGVAGVGLSWSLVWGVAFAVLGLIAATVHPQDLDPGEGPAVIVGTGLLVGFMSGVVYGLILAGAEKCRVLADLSPVSSAVWGSLAAATPAFVTPAHPSMLLILCPLGALWASAALMIVRRSEVHDPKCRVSRFVGRLLGRPLRAVWGRPTR
jgi:hypothetical protein